MAVPASTQLRPTAIAVEVHVRNVRPRIVAGNVQLVPAGDGVRNALIRFHLPNPFGILRRGVDDSHVRRALAPSVLGDHPIFGIPTSSEVDDLDADAVTMIHDAIYEGDALFVDPAVVSVWPLPVSVAESIPDPIARVREGRMRRVEIHRHDDVEERILRTLPLESSEMISGFLNGAYEIRVAEAVTVTFLALFHQQSPATGPFF